jgi:hypothetical protein
MTDRDKPTAGDDVGRSDQLPAQDEAKELALEDFYYEGAYLVFTEAYHLKRGYCCNSGCRHCPYR